MRKGRIAFACLFLLCIAAGFVSSFTNPDYWRLGTEVRKQGAAEPQGYIETLEENLSRQLPFRDTMIGWGTELRRMAGQKNINGVYILGDRMLSAAEEKDADIGYYNARAFNSFVTEVEKPAVCMLVPSATEIYSQQLDPNIPQPEETELINGITRFFNTHTQMIDAVTPLSTMKDSYIYYRTDNCWTSFGAYVGYSTMAKALGIQSFSSSEFNIEHIHDFSGDLYDATQYNGIRSDTVDLYYHRDGEAAVTMEWYRDGKVIRVSDSLYSRQFLEDAEKDKVFLGEPAPMVRIQTTSKTGNRLLVIKDSYADSMVQFLSLHFSEIILVDLQQSDVSIGELVSPEEYDQILLLCGVEQFMSDPSFLKLC